MTNYFNDVFSELTTEKEIDYTKPYDNYDYDDFYDHTFSSETDDFMISNYIR